MKIFFDDRYVHLLKPVEEFEGQIVLPGSVKELEEIIGSFEQDQSQKVLGVDSPDYKQLKRDVKSLFTVVKAAGGVVRNERGEILFIHRRGKWDLPKGKINYELGIKNEEFRISNFEFRISEAIREVKEETGLREVKAIRPLKPTWHVYYDKGKRMLKKTWWFEMQAPGDQPLMPQTEEDILYVRWFRPDELEVVLENTFGSLREMIAHELHMDCA